MRTGLVVLISLALIALGIFALVVGMHDVILRDEPLRVTTTGAVISLAGLLVLFAGVLLLIFVLNLSTIEVWSGRVILAACWLVAIGAAYLTSSDTRWTALLASLYADIRGRTTTACGQSRGAARPPIAVSTSNALAS
jgi:hypothetical protein